MTHFAIEPRKYVRFSPEETRGYPELVKLQEDGRIVDDPELFKWIEYSIRLRKAVLPDNSDLRVIVALEFTRYNLSQYFPDVQKIVDKFKADQETIRVKEELERIRRIKLEKEYEESFRSAFGETETDFHVIMTKPIYIYGFQRIYILADEGEIYTYVCDGSPGQVEKIATTKVCWQFPVSFLTKNKTKSDSTLEALAVKKDGTRCFAGMKDEYGNVATLEFEVFSNKLTTVSIEIFAHELEPFFDSITAIDSDGNLFVGDKIVLANCRRIQKDVQFPQRSIVDHDWFTRVHTQKQKDRGVERWLHTCSNPNGSILKAPDFESQDMYFQRIYLQGICGQKIFISAGVLIGSFRVFVYFPKTSAYPATVTTTAVDAKRFY